MITETQIDNLEVKLEEMANKEPEGKRPTSGKAVFGKYKTQIMKLIDMGYTPEHIKNVLDSVGVKMTTSTVRQYIRDIHRVGGQENPTGATSAYLDIDLDIDLDDG